MKSTINVAIDFDHDEKTADVQVHTVVDGKAKEKLSFRIEHELEVDMWDQIGERVYAFMKDDPDFAHLGS